MSDVADRPDPTQEPRAGSGAMFDVIAARYDLLNRILSLGIDQSWRRRLVRALQLKPGHLVLDHATGTADLAILIARSCPEVRVLAVDPSRNMLEIGREKVEQAGLASRIELRTGDAERLVDVADGSVDAVSIAFGIRNVPDRLAALREFRRVTRPGGIIAILELSEPPAGALGTLSRLYLHQLVPRIGALLSGASEYRYLQQSIARFPPAKEFARLIDEAGIEVRSVQPLTFGVCHLYVGCPKK